MNLLISDTSALVWLRVSGDDANAFLQGQLSNDVLRLTVETAQLSSYSSPKGRMLAVLQLVRAGEEIFIELPRAIADATLARLKMFVLRAKVRIEKADDIDALDIFGDDAPALLTRLGLPFADAAQQCRHSERGLRVLRRPGTQMRFTVFGARESIAALRAATADVAHAPDALLRRRSDIENGVPVVLAGTRDHFVAQMANLDLFGGISFDKGCYTGQEIVARLHYLGQLKRRMFTAQIEAPAPAPGSAVYANDDTQAAGEIVDAVISDDGRSSIATLVLQLSARAAVLTVGDDRVALRLAPLSAPPLP